MLTYMFIHLSRYPHITTCRVQGRDKEILVTAVPQIFFAFNELSRRTSSLRLLCPLPVLLSHQSWRYRHNGTERLIRTIWNCSRRPRGLETRTQRALIPFQYCGLGHRRAHGRCGGITRGFESAKRENTWRGSSSVWYERRLRIGRLMFAGKLDWCCTGIVSVVWFTRWHCWGG